MNESEEDNNSASSLVEDAKDKHEEHTSAPAADRIDHGVTADNGVDSCYESPIALSDHVGPLDAMEERENLDQEQSSFLETEKVLSSTAADDSLLASSIVNKKYDIEDRGNTTTERMTLANAEGFLFSEDGDESCGEELLMDEVEVEDTSNCSDYCYFPDFIDTFPQASDELVNTGILRELDMDRIQQVAPSIHAEQGNLSLQSFQYAISLQPLYYILSNY